MTRPVIRAGVFPWLPWPLRAMRWWTEPVAAQRLAVLRIGIGLCLLLDVLTSYWPNREILFGPDSLGTFENYTWYAEGSRRWWSILRGPSNDLNFTLAFFPALGLAAWLILDARTRWLGDDANPPRPSAWLVVAWSFLSSYALAGFWVRVLKNKEVGPDAPLRLWMWIVPLLLAILTALLWAVEAWVTYRPREADEEEKPPPSRAFLHSWYAASWAYFPLLVLAGFLLHFQETWTDDAPHSWVRTLLEPWLLSRTLIAACMVVWLIALVMLTAGFRTRLAAVAVWVLSTSFANVQPRIDNAGDTIRGIILFYLMLCPCGAVWSLDSLLQRPRRPAEARVVVSPWPIRLLFLQLVLIYFMNGVYKLLSPYWREGKTLYYVLHDLTLTRFSFAELPISYDLARILTVTVLIWELTFPLLVLWWPTRFVALLFGVGFHVGIGLSMDLGLFALYALCLYLPLLPWEWLTERRRKVGPAPAPAAETLVRTG